MIVSWLLIGMLLGFELHISFSTEMECQERRAVMIDQGAVDVYCIPVRAP